MIAMSSLMSHTMTAHRLCSLAMEAYKLHSLAPPQKKLEFDTKNFGHKGTVKEWEKGLKH